MRRQSTESDVLSEEEEENSIFDGADAAESTETGQKAPRGRSLPPPLCTMCLPVHVDTGIREGSSKPHSTASLTTNGC